VVVAVLYLLAIQLTLACALTHSAAVTVNNWLYVEGGEFYANKNGNPTFFYCKHDLAPS
jgi:hypothetical protein